MTRDEAFNALLPIKEQVFAETQKRLKGSTIHGRKIIMDIVGQKHRMLHYPSGKATAPVYFDIHGGGFCWGMIEENDQFCLNVNQQLGIEVYELDYPLVPDAVFPTALNWLYETISYIVQNSDEFHIDPARMAVGGQSAGANLAAALTLMAKDRGEFQFACQVLDYPALDIGAGVVNEAERFFGEGAMPRQVLDLLYAAYATEEEQKSRFCSPLNATLEEMYGLPSAVIQTCEWDSLRPDGELYAEKLKEARVPVISHCYPNVYHGFTYTDGPEKLNGQQYLIDGMRRFIYERTSGERSECRSKAGSCAELL